VVFFARDHSSEAMTLSLQIRGLQIVRLDYVVGGLMWEVGGCICGARL
jgi:hypothetical protein